MQPYLGPPWTDSHHIWAVDVFHHASLIHGIQNAKMKKKKKKKFFAMSSLLYSIIVVWLERSRLIPRSHIISLKRHAKGVRPIARIFKGYRTSKSGPFGLNHVCKNPNRWQKVNLFVWLIFACPWQWVCGGLNNSYQSHLFNTYPYFPCRQPW